MFCAHSSTHQRHRLAHVEPARLRRRGARNEGRIDHVDVERDEHRLVRGFRLVEDVLHHRLPAARLDLGHHVVAQPVAAVPLDPAQIGGVRPAQADLDDVLAIDEAALDQLPHRIAVGHEMAEADRRLIGMGVEMDDHQVALAVDVGEPGGVGVHQGMAAADDDRDGPLAALDLDIGDVADELADGRDRPLDAHGLDRRVAVVDHGELVERRQAAIELRHIEGAPVVVDLGAVRVAHLHRPIGAGAHVADQLRTEDRDLDIAGLEILRRQCHRQMEEGRDADPGHMAIEALDVDRPRLPAFADILADLLPDIIRRIVGIEPDDRLLARVHRVDLLGRVRRTQVLG